MPGCCFVGRNLNKGLARHPNRRQATKENVDAVRGTSLGFDMYRKLSVVTQFAPERIRSCNQTAVVRVNGTPFDVQCRPNTTPRKSCNTTASGPRPILH
jgi:hypothetical protein